MNGQATKKKIGVGLVIIHSVGEIMEYAMKFDFLASNNEVEYKALTLGL